MRLENYQEEIVLALIHLVLEDHPEIAADETFIHDAAAYVLNRLPPRYIMSERGLTRMAAEQWLLDPDDQPSPADGKDAALARMVELLILVNRALDVVERRRRDGGAGQPRRRGHGSPRKIELQSEFWHNLPQIIGRLLDARARTPIAGATVTLSAGRLGVLRSERGWSNPCGTKDETRGYFSLWPRAIRDPVESKTLTLRFAFEHPDYVPCTREYRYRSHGELMEGGQLVLGRLINLGTQLMAPRRRGGRAAQP